MIVSTEVASRKDVRRALDIKFWPEILLGLFAPVFALLAAVSGPKEGRMAVACWVLAFATALVAGFSFVEKRRKVALGLEIARRRHELSSQGIQYEGSLLRTDTPLRSFPIQTSFLVVSLRTATCPSAAPRPAAKVCAIALNALLGWWSLGGVFSTPFRLWSCFKGGELTTPGELIAELEGRATAKT